MAVLILFFRAHELELRRCCVYSSTYCAARKAVSDSVRLGNRCELSLTSSPPSSSSSSSSTDASWSAIRAT